jgi:hypothetical protein
VGRLPGRDADRRGAAGRPGTGLELARGDYAVFVREWLPDGQVRAWRWTRLSVGLE